VIYACEYVVLNGRENLEVPTRVRKLLYAEAAQELVSQVLISDQGIHSLNQIDVKRKGRER